MPFSPDEISRYAPETLEQFEIDDQRTPAEVAAFLEAQGYEAVWKDWDATYDGHATSKQGKPRMDANERETQAAELHSR